MKDYKKQAYDFLDQIFNEIKKYSLTIKPNQIDHLCYRTSTLDNYQETKDFFETQGKLLIEGEIGSRPIATYKLLNPIKYKNQSIDVIEIPAPKNGSHYSQGFEHFEVVINDSFQTLIEQHSDLKFDTKAITKAINPDIKIQLKSGSIKFHHQSLEKVIEAELCRK